MNLYNYQTGELIRQLSVEECDLYTAVSNNGASHGGTGTVDGDEFGVDVIVYAI